MIVPVAPLGETVAVKVTDVPDVAEVTDGVTVVVVLPLVLAELELLPPQPIITKGQQLNAITIKMARNAVGRWNFCCM